MTNYWKCSVLLAIGAPACSDSVTAPRDSAEGPNLVVAATNVLVPVVQGFANPIALGTTLDFSETVDISGGPSGVTSYTPTTTGLVQACTPAQFPTQVFDNPLVLGATAASGTWYTDRYAPGVFESYNFNGEMVLRHGVRIVDGASNRPASYSSAFYNTQGRKYDTPGATSMSIDIYIDASWIGEDRSAGLWATGFDASNAISAYPILAFRSSGDSPLWGGTTVSPGFYAWNYIAGGYSVGFQAVGDYDRWYNLKFVLTPGVGTSYYIDGVFIGSLSDPNTTDLGNVILNVTNFGDEDHDVLWDNFSSGQTCVTVPVYDPAIGFVTGGGWFMSPAGAYVADAGLTGKATFGFVSKYVKGKTLPTGNTQFQFQAGALVFSSSEYEWLVVNQAGMNAQFKGVGSLNGVPGFKFMVWAKDGTPDTFRIQIADGAGTVVYDNKQDSSFGTALGGGSIMIHVPKK